MSETPQTENKTIVVDTPQGIAMYRLLALAHALGLEITTGMKASRHGSPMNTVRAMGISVKRTKRGVLADLIKHIQTINPAFEVRGSLEKALKK